MMNEIPENKAGDAPDARRKEEKPSSLTIERRKCSYTKGGKCRDMEQEPRKNGSQPAPT